MPDHRELDALQALVPWEVRLEDSNRYGRTTIHLLAPIDTARPDVIAKQDGYWTADGPRLAFDAHSRISAALGHLDRIHLPQAIGWSADPPTLTMERAQGHSVSSMLRAAVKAETTWAEATDAVRLAGTALAALHAQLESPTQRERDVLAYSQRMFRPRSSSVSGSELPTVCRVTDYATYNQLYSGEHGFVLIDPPVKVQATIPHDDVGYYLASIVHSVVGSNQIRLRRRATHAYRHLAEDFVGAYSSAGHHDLSDRRDREIVSLVAGYHSANWSRRRWKRVQYRRASVNAGVWAAKTYVGPGAKPWLRSAPDGPADLQGK